MNTKFKIKPIWIWEFFHGNGELFHTEYINNICTIEGINYVLDSAFGDSTAITEWYFELAEDDFTASEDSTYAIPGWTACTAYTELTRQLWNSASSSNKVKTNSANKAEVNFNDSKTIYGGGIVGGGTEADTKGNSDGGGKLFNQAKLVSSQAVVSGDKARITLTITGSDQ